MPDAALQMARARTDGRQLAPSCLRMQALPRTDGSIGDKVRLAEVPTYLKTADPMPMLRPRI